MGAKRPIRIVVLGAPKVGKTAITVRYLTHRFIGEYSSRADVVYKHTANIGGEKTELEILDTCKSSIERREGDGYLVVFSVTEPSSLAAAAGILAGLPQARPVLLLANKIDLEHARTVTLRSALELSVIAGCSYLEVSASSSAMDRGGIPLAFAAVASKAKPVSPLRAAIRALAALLSYRKVYHYRRTSEMKWK
ncbi:ras-like protein family member 11B [Halyomorpha halys]|uniref:ras-like protein family member 11B n=1 Tax=Halyomorpha halys TaxID=286706 RepID=UPI0006D51F8F|nr:ras-like protein family member 11B [Halyomorpha halys]